MALLGSLKFPHYGGVLRRLIYPKMFPSHCKKHTEPDYLHLLGPQKPVYDVLNFCAKSYDFTVIENYGRFVHRTANKLGFDVTETWAAPAHVSDVNTFKPQSTIVDQKYKLYMYQRIIQISELPCYMLGVFVRLIRAGLPNGVELSILPHSEEQEEYRYIPDTDLLNLKGQLDELNEPTTKGKKKH